MTRSSQSISALDSQALIRQYFSFWCSRRKADRLLGEILAGGPPATEALLQELSRNRSEVHGVSHSMRREAALRALGRVGSPGLFDFLLAELRFGFRDVAVQMLGTLGDRAAISALLNSMRMVAGEDAAEAIVRLATAEDVPTLHEALRLLPCNVSEATGLTIAYHNSARAKLIGALALFQDPGAVPLLLAYDWLGWSPEKTLLPLGALATPEVIAALKLPYLLDMELVVKILVQVGEPAVGPIRAALGECLPSQRPRFAVALASLGDRGEALVPLLVKALSQRELAPAAAHALSGWAQSAPTPGLCAAIAPLSELAAERLVPGPVQNACREALQAIEVATKPFRSTPLPAAAPNELPRIASLVELEGTQLPRVP